METYGYIALAVVVLAGPVDTALTLQFWAYEGNPVVRRLGKVGYLLVKSLFVFLVLWLWMFTRTYETAVGFGTLVWLFALYAFVTLHNIREIWRGFFSPAPDR